MFENKYTVSSPHTRDLFELCEINQHLKASLTELLNTKLVRSEEKYRTFIQQLLIGIEQRTRKQRRRISNKDRETAAFIAISFGATV